MNLLTLPDKFIERLTTNIRWCIKGPMAMGEKRYAIVDCASAKSAAMGQIKTGKQNNFNGKLLLLHAIAWEQMVNSVEAFVTGSQ